MNKTIKIVKKEITNCADCPWMSPTPNVPSDMDSEIVLICSHPDTCRSQGFAWNERILEDNEPFPEWCPLESKK